MSALVPQVYERCKIDGKIAIIFLDHDETTSKRGALPLWKVIPEPGYVEAIRVLAGKGDRVVPTSARGLEGLVKGYAPISDLNLPIIYNDGMGIAQGGHTLKTSEPEPDWRNTMERLSKNLPAQEDAKLVAQGYSFYYYIDKEHSQYDLGAGAFQAEVAMLNTAAGYEKWKYGAYPNGHIIELADKVGKAQAIKDYLQLLCEEFECRDLGELFELHIGCVIFADDSPSPTVIEGQRFVKNLTSSDEPVGYSYLVSRDGTIPAVIPDHVNEVVRNSTEMVARLKAMADYLPKN